MRQVCILVATILALAIQGQEQDSIALNWAGEISEKELREHLYIIASDDYEGRETGMPGQKKAEEYLVEHYQSLGLSLENDIHVQEYKLYLTEPGAVQVQTAGTTFTFLEDFYYYPAGADGDYEQDLLFSGYGIEEGYYDDVDDDLVRGKAILIRQGEPKDRQGDFILSENGRSSWSQEARKKISLLASKGASAVFIISPDYQVRKKRVAPFFSRKGMKLDYLQEEAEMPVFYINESMAKVMMGEKQHSKAMKRLAKGKPYTKSLPKVRYAFERKGNILTSSNVMVYIEGSDLKEELVVVTAHYDHIGKRGKEVSNGADDDGSGTVAAMEIAESFILAKKAGHGPRRSVLVLHVSGEEKGLLGSKYYVDHPIWPLENTIADFNIDMIGRVDAAHDGPGEENYIYLIGAGRISPALEELCEETKETYSEVTYDYTYDAEDDPNRYYYRSDHYNFAEKGIPSVFYFSGVHEDYHMPGDTPDKIMYPKLARITRLIFHTVWSLANREEGLPTGP